MKISVVMVNYNYGRYISDAINSLLSQMRPPDEIIVVDDGSSDDSRARLKEFDGVANVLLQENFGQTAATNRGIAAATGDVVAMLDSDDLAAPERLLEIEKAYKAHNECQWVFHNVQYIQRDSGVMLQTPARIGFTAGMHDHRRAVARGRLPLTMPPTSGLSWRSTFLRRFIPTPSPLGSQDNYLKFLSIAHAPGFVIEQPLSLQGIHEHNMYTALDNVSRKSFALLSTIQMVPGLSENGAPALSRRLLASAFVDSLAGRKLDEENRRSLRNQVLATGILRLAPAFAEATARSGVGHYRALRLRAHYSGQGNKV